MLDCVGYHQANASFGLFFASTGKLKQEDGAWRHVEVGGDCRRAGTLSLSYDVLCFES